MIADSQSQVKSSRAFLLVSRAGLPIFPGYIFFICMICIVVQFPLNASADTQHLGKCGDACNCAENLIVNGGDGDEKFPIDKDPDGDDSENYKLNEVGSLQLDPNESAVGVVAEEWLKTPDEILTELHSRLSEGERAVYQFISEGKTVGNYIADRLFPDLVAHGHATGVHHHPGIDNFEGSGAAGQYWALRIGKKNCFFKRAWYMIGPQRSIVFSRYGTYNGDWEGALDQLKFCVPQTWMGGDPQTQLEAFFDNEKWKTSGVAIMDFAVGMTPFLNTADLIFNQKILDDVYDGQVDKLGQLCGAVAGDFFVGAKVVNRLASAARGVKILQVAGFSSGCGSVVFTGGYLGHKSITGDLNNQDYGQAAFLGIEIIGLILDRPAQQLFEEFVWRTFYKGKKPSSTCLACGPKCSPVDLSPEQVDFQKSTLPALKRSATCQSCSPPSQKFKLIEGIEGLVQGSKEQLEKIATGIGWQPGKEVYALAITTPKDPVCRRIGIQHWQVIRIAPDGTWTRRTISAQSVVFADKVTENMPPSLEDAIFITWKDLSDELTAKLRGVFHKDSTYMFLHEPTSLSCAHDAMSTFLGRCPTLFDPDCSFRCSPNFRRLLDQNSLEIGGSHVDLSFFTTSKDVEKIFDKILGTDRSAVLLVAAGYAYFEILRQMLTED